jgi:flagellar protein FlgJ
MTHSINGLTEMMARQSMMTGEARKNIAADDPEEMKKACKDFESLFVSHLLKEMRNTVPQNDLFGGGPAEKIYTAMLDGEVAKHVSHQRGIGLAEMLYDQVVKNGPKKM